MAKLTREDKLVKFRAARDIERKAERDIERKAEREKYCKDRSPDPKDRRCYEPLYSKRLCKQHYYKRYGNYHLKPRPQNAALTKALTTNGGICSSPYVDNFKIARARIHHLEEALVQLCGREVIAKCVIGMRGTKSKYYSKIDTHEKAITYLLSIGFKDE